RGGMTSHAAVVARGMGRPCVSGAGNIQIDYKAKNFRVGDREVKEGDIITIDGSTGEVMVGEVTTIKPDISGDFSTIMSWADEARTLKIRTNAETPLDTKVAREFGAEGIGLCRTEHMFFDEERILYVRQMILSKNIEDRNKALKNILPYQKKDFVEIFKTMHGLPVTVRLLDPPLHEFLPKSEKEINSVAKILNISEREIQNRIADLHEENPMLGHRGCRLAISYPEIYEMQCEAIFEALVECDKDKSEPVIPEIMIPLISTAKELEILKALVERKATEVQAKHGVSIKYLIGTMIEIPRAALNAFDIAKHADFFSFGTNDLTQTTLGISRDDSGKFLDDYVNNNIFAIDPFVSIDVNGVGQLVKLACEQGMKQNKNIKLGICGEHGGDPDSIDFCHNAGLNYVSCSPYRVPIARLAAAQAKIRASQK
ncbi:MAG: pyruvate, phosphate dikinase, partial [Pelagibacteraceae bacterium]|nr:pyruvate, phosphate dikinase [Pelagibacteraceae bacterium]